MARRRLLRCFSSKPEVDLYGILGLQKGASGEEIKTAYRRLAKELHPDLGHRDEATAERFRQVSHAHNTLLHVGMRRMYDLQLRRKEAAERCRHLESQELWWSKVMAGPLGPSIVGFFAAMSCFGALLLGTMGGKAFLEGSESYFWLIFRYLPEFPGKWRLAAAMRRSES